MAGHQAAVEAGCGGQGHGQPGAVTDGARRKGNASRRGGNTPGSQDHASRL